MTTPVTPPQDQTAVAARPARRNGVGLAALIIGIVAVVFALIPFLSYIAWLIGIVAAILGIVAIARASGRPKGAGVTGLILGVLAILLSIVMSVVYTAVFVAAAATGVSSSGDSVKGLSSAAATPPASDDSSEAAPATEEPSTPAEPAVKTKTYKGSSDKVLKFDISDPVVMTFTCKSCSGNTAVKTDSGTSTLPVNTIGAYTGRHLLNTSDGALLTRIVISADARWSLKIEDASVAAASFKRVEAGSTIKGKGDDVVIVSEGVTDSDVRNVGDGNFSITSYGGSDSLPVNEIGSYSGNVVLDGPAVAQVESDGKWSIKGNG